MKTNTRSLLLLLLLLLLLGWLGRGIMGATTTTSVWHPTILPNPTPAQQQQQQQQQQKSLEEAFGKRRHHLNYVVTIRQIAFV
jgi:hypothetical protein